MNDFFLVKIIKAQYTESLMSGNVYMQSLRYFREQETGNTKAQADSSEGTIGMIGATSIEELNKNLRELGQYNCAEFFDNIREDFKKDIINPRVFIEKEYEEAEIIDKVVHIKKPVFLEKVFCLYTFYFDNTTKEYQIPSPRIKAFSDCNETLSVVIIHNCVEFLKRVRVTASKIGISFVDKVRYKNFSTIDGVDIFDGFCKDNEYMWQQEFRIACREHNPSLEPLTLNIGDISDIAIKIDCINDFLDPVRFCEIMAEHNMVIKDYKPVVKELNSEEQDIPFCLLKEYELTRALYSAEKEAHIHYKEAANAMEAGNYSRAKGKLNDFKLMIRQEPFFTDCKFIEQQLFWLYLRLVENLLECGDKENLCYFYIKSRYFHKRFVVGDFKMSTYDILRRDVISSKAEECLKGFDIISFLKKDKAAGFAALENATFNKNEKKSE